MSAYRIMWLVVMFDLPTKTKKDKKAYHWFHNELEKEGYIMLQYSVYTKAFASSESLSYGKKRLKEFIDKNLKHGNIRFLSFTDKQFSNMEIIIGEQSIEEENEPKQLLLF